MKHLHCLKVSKIGINLDLRAIMLMIENDGSLAADFDFNLERGNKSVAGWQQL